MNIPIDRLYYYIHSVAQKNFDGNLLIYGFLPHGSKNIENLNALNALSGGNSWINTATSLLLYCNDQEPLRFDYYSKHLRKVDCEWAEILKQIGMAQPITNLNYVVNAFQKNILLHSEKNSIDAEKYLHANELIPTYYWSHAVIARDWFRFAEHASFYKNPTKLFLIYNRSWSGTREYRIKFADLLIDHGIQEICKTSFNAQDSDTGEHYKDHKFVNPSWKAKHQLENFFQPTMVDANSSADFEISDYESTEIEVVLETLFDDARWHLTEKILRPIACGQPFILVGTAGSLQYLREYGFKTFADVWSEEYDIIEDPSERLVSITELMKYLASLDTKQRNILIEKAQNIALYNKRRFFSQEFFDMVIGELESNLSMALNQIKKLPLNQNYIDKWNKILASDLAINFLKTNQHSFSPTLESAYTVLSFAKGTDKNDL